MSIEISKPSVQGISAVNKTEGDAAADNKLPAGDNSQQLSRQAVNSNSRRMPADEQSLAAVSITAAEVTQTQDELAPTVEAAVEAINDHMQTIHRTLQFTVDEASGRDVVTVKDTATEEVIRQYPSDEILAIARRLAEERDKAIQLFQSQV